MTNRASARAILASVASELQTDTARIVCPFCNGGNDNESSLVLTVSKDGTFYCCHRASCGQAGVLGPSLGASGSKVPAKRKPHEPYTGEIREPFWISRALLRWYKIPRGGDTFNYLQAGLHTDQTDENEVWVLRDLKGRVIGHQVRKLSPKGRKLVKSWKIQDTSASLYHAPGFKTARSTVAWIVEDPLSAATLRTWGYPAVALLGTVLHDDLADQLGSHVWPRSYVIALDPGAENAAKACKRKLECYTTRPVRIAYTRDDIKDMNKPQLYRLLKEYG